MDMHRAHRQADWASIPEAERTVWQRRAAGTNGWLTPANLISFSGLALVMVGLILFARHDYMQGIVLLVVGRCADIFDGIVADKTRTKSHIGEGVDAGIDKIALVAAAFVLISSHKVPLLLIAAILGIHIAVAVISLYAQWSSLELHPSRTGKYATVFLWVGIGFYLLAIARATIHTKTLGAWSLTVSIGLVLYAFGTYVRDVWRGSSAQKATGEHDTAATATSREH